MKHKGRILAILILVVALIAGGVWYGLSRLGWDLAQAGQRDARKGVVYIVDALRNEHLETGDLAADVTIEELMGFEPYQVGHFDGIGYTLTVRGQAPAFSGTTVTYPGRLHQHPIVLVVNNLELSDWDVLEFPRPKPWWAPSPTE